MDTIDLREKIAGEIVNSPSPNKTIKKWREEFDISQQELARELNVAPSVICDYESGRRKSPGIGFIKKFIDTILKIDERRGRTVISRYSNSLKPDAILAIREFPFGISAKSFIETINGELLTSSEPQRDVHGYTVIDSVRAILTLNAHDYMKIFGWSNERALIFTGVKYGRSPMIAIRVHPLKPSMVVYLRPAKIDPLAKNLAELENIPLVITKIKVETLIEKLEDL